MTARRIALATSQDFPQLAPDDQLLEARLRNQGHVVSVLVWDEPAAWGAFDIVVVRSCWDYHRKRPLFLEWIDRLQDSGVLLQNAPALLRWNHDKRYLRDLESQGIPTAETEWLEQGSQADLKEILKRHGWQQAVIKPRVSATAWRTSRTSQETAAADQQQLDHLLADADVMVQGFLDEIVLAGEFSFIYFDGERSHVVLKRARPGDYRVQEEFAGTVEAVQVPQSLWRQADAVLETLHEVPLYARVDGPIIAGQLHVLELELIEPALYLAMDARAAARFAAATLRRL